MGEWGEGGEGGGHFGVGKARAPARAPAAVASGPAPLLFSQADKTGKVNIERLRRIIEVGAPSNPCAPTPTLPSHPHQRHHHNLISTPHTHLPPPPSPPTAFPSPSPPPAQDFELNLNVEKLVGEVEGKTEIDYDEFKLLLV
jgi:hypothetical protein